VYVCGAAFSRLPAIEKLPHQEEDISDNSEDDSSQDPRWAFSPLPSLPEQEQAMAAQTLAKLRAGIRKIRASTLNRHHWMAVCRENGRKPLVPILDVAVRWSSTFHMLQRATEYKAVSLLFDGRRAAACCVPWRSKPDFYKTFYRSTIS
jgi:hypothetical protein